jgi:hypothetical protein
VPQAELDGEAASADNQTPTDKSLYEIKLRNKQVLSKMAVQVMKFDRELGDNVISGWTTWKKGEEVILPKTTGKVYQDLDEYLPDRFNDIGWPYVPSQPHHGSLLTKANARMVINLLHWGTGVVLDESSAKEIAPILRPIHDVVTLTNDYFSWEKEIAEHIELKGTTPLINSVAFYMKWDSLSATDAKAAVKAKIQQLEENYSALKAEYIARHGDKAPSSVIRWFNVMEAVVAGNLIWSNFTPRYHVSNIKAHEYEEYYSRRIREGASFFDSCTESDAFIPQASYQSSSEPRPSAPHSPANGVNGVNGASHDSTNIQSTSSDMITAMGNHLDENTTAKSLIEPSHERKRRGSVDSRLDSVTQQPTPETASLSPESDFGNQFDTQKKRQKVNGLSSDHEGEPNSDTTRKLNGHVDHHSDDSRTGQVNGESRSNYCHCI